jgi:RimJ/RimL family protein N-acetyltransferase
VSDPFWLTTQRLALRRFTRADVDWLMQLYGNENVMRHMGGVKDRAKTQLLLDERILAYYDANPGLGIWCTVERATGERLGMHLLNNIQGETDLQVGYVLAETAWGRGIATEMAAALLRYGFADLGLPRIVAITNLENRASQRVLEKVGLLRKGERSFAHPAYAGRPMAWFERDGGSWLAAHPAHR